MEIPTKNYVGELQHLCQTARMNLPEYIESDVSDGSSFKFICKLKDWTSHGSGSSKKFAKHFAAKQMIEKIKCENLFLGPSEQNNKNLCGSSVSKLIEYCMKAKKGNALFAELPKEKDMFRCQCSLEGFSAIGEGSSKKEAKEKAALAVADHFEVHNYFNTNRKQPVGNNLIQDLTVFCQKNNLGAPNFEEIEIQENNITNYQVTCSVGDLKITSGRAISKKAAKLEAAALMLETLKSNTPVDSPVELPVEQHASGDSEPREESPPKKLRST